MSRYLLTFSRSLNTGYYYHVIIILIDSSTNPCFFSKKQWLLKTLTHSQTLSLNQSKNYIFMISKGWSFCDQIFKSAANLDGKFTFVIFIFFKFSSSFFENTFLITFQSVVAFQQYQIYHFFFHFSKDYNGSKKFCNE